jgi:hypothetical protein
MHKITAVKKFFGICPEETLYLCGNASHHNSWTKNVFFLGKPIQKNKNIYPSGYLLEQSTHDPKFKDSNLVATEKKAAK